MSPLFCLWNLCVENGSPLSLVSLKIIIELPHNKTNKMICVLSKSKNGFLGSQGSNASSCEQRRLIRLGDVWADPSLCCAHILFFWFYRAVVQLLKATSCVNRNGILMLCG